MSGDRANRPARDGPGGDRPAHRPGERNGCKVDTQRLSRRVSRLRVVSDPDAAYDFIRQHFYIGRTQDMKGLVQLRGDDVIAAVIFDSFTTHNCFMHIASDGSKKWMTRHGLHEVFKYAFITAGCERVTLWVEATNADSRALVQGLGFTLEAVLHRAGRDGVDVLIYRMFRQECRYA